MDTTVATFLQAPSAPPAPELPPPGALLREAIRFYRAHLGIMLGIAAVPAAFAVIAELLGEPVPHSLIVVIGIVAALAGIAGRIALMEAVAENGTPAGGAVSAYQKGVHLILPFLWLSAMSSFAIIGGFFLLVVPGVLLTFWLSLAAYVLIGENKRGLAALVASWQYVHGYWLPVLWRFAFFGIAIILVTVGLAIILNVAATSLGPSAPIQGSGAPQNMPFGSIAQGLFANFVVLPLSVIYAFSLYRALRRAKATAAPATPEETAKMRKRLVMFAVLGIVGSVLVVAALGALIVKYLPEIQNILKNAGVDTAAPNVFPQTPLNTAAGLIPLLRSLY